MRCWLAAGRLAGPGVVSAAAGDLAALQEATKPLVRGASGLNSPYDAARKDTTNANTAMPIESTVRSTTNLWIRMFAMA